MNDIVQYQGTAVATAADIRAQVNRVQEVMKAVMQPDVHFGKIPGTPKPTLYKPGAEVLCTTFHIAPKYRVEDLSTDDYVRYRVTCVGVHQTSSIEMGEGLGECSSNEEKYKWRKATGSREFDGTPENRRRIKYGYDRQSREEYEIKQVRTEPADVANTILKMAAKRAQVAMTLNVTAASDCFTQDIEDLPKELQDQLGEDGERRDEKKSQPREPKSKSGDKPADDGNAKVTDGEVKWLANKIGDASGIGMGEITKRFAIEKFSTEMTRAQFRDVKSFLVDPAGYDEKHPPQTEPPKAEANADV